MILEFRTPRNTYGHREYIRIDTDMGTFTREPHFIPEGIEIKRADYRELVAKVKGDGYKEQ